MESLHCLFGLDIIWVNTDGLILRVKRSQLNKVHNRLAELEIKFGISFGTQRELRRVYVKNVNMYIRITEKNEVLLKGMKSSGEPSCYTSVLKSLLIQLETTSYKFNYFKLCQEFSTLVDVREFVYVNRNEYSKPIRYICSNSPQYYGGDLHNIKRDKIARNFTLCPLNLKLLLKEDVCINYYVFTLLTKVTEFGLILDDLESPYDLVKIVFNGKTKALPLLEKGMELAKEGLFCTAGYGVSYLEKRHLLECQDDPIDHLKRTFVKDSISWLKASSLHVLANKHTDLLIISLKWDISKSSLHLQHWIEDFKKKNGYYLESKAGSDDSIECNFDTTSRQNHL